MDKKIYKIEIPADYYKHYKLGERPILSVGGIVLTEEHTGKIYAYKAVEARTGESERLFNTRSKLCADSYDAASKKAAASALGQKYPGAANSEESERRDLNENMQTELEAIFTNIMPQHGFGIREGQIELASEMLAALCHKRTIISEAGLGIGKTYAYILASLLVKLRKANDSWIRMNYLYSKNFTERTRLPIVISTSSIALQTAIVNDYIPRVSQILLDCGLIQTPLAAVLRKGKEHYICDYRLVSYANSGNRGGQFLKDLLDVPVNRIDLDEMDWLDPIFKARINVPDYCVGAGCVDYDGCRYMELMRLYMTDKYDFQVCNHNLFIADALRRGQKAESLLPNYQAAVIDEAHKFLPAARQMYGISFSAAETGAFRAALDRFKYMDEEKRAAMMSYYEAALQYSDDFFKHLSKGSIDPEGNPDRVPIKIGGHALSSLRQLRDNMSRMRALLRENVADMDLVSFRRLSSKIKDMNKRIEKLLSPEGLICWQESPVVKGAKNAALAAVPKDLGKALYEDIWMKSIPKIITSGTLAVRGDFSFTKANLGLDRLVPDRLVEIAKPSPFNYREHCLMYISENVPFPMPPDNAGVRGYKEYIDAVASEVETLIEAACGHTAVLFTSYQVMGAVYNKLRHKLSRYPLFKMNKSDTAVTDRFRTSGNGVLFAAGPFWEGIDLPGDILSSLIIVKLPFAMPDPVNEYERSLCGSDEEYKEKYIFADMVFRLMQGIGRLIRSEADTGVVCILDFRMKTGGKYRIKVLESLPEYRLTSSIKVVRDFLRRKKPRAYFS